MSSADAPGRLTVLAETAPGERRVAAVPATVRQLVASGWTVEVVAGAGRWASFADAAYANAGARVVPGPTVGRPQVVVSVQPAPLTVLGSLAPGATVVSLLAPAVWPEHVRRCRDSGLTALALELVPRISRAQPMDVLTSQAMVVGDRGVLLAAQHHRGPWGGLRTAAGSLPPARVLVLGTGIVGLRATATARRFGAEVLAHDVRPSSADEVPALGATFLPLGEPHDDAAGGYARIDDPAFLATQRTLLAPHVAAADVVLATASVPGRPAPSLLSAGMVAAMRPGSVVVDLAAEAGGNCELTRPGEQVEHAGVVVLGPTQVASDLPGPASELFARNVAELLGLLHAADRRRPDWSDAVLSGCCLTRDGRLISPAAAAALDEPPPSDATGTDASPGAPQAHPVAEVSPVRRTDADAVARLLADGRRVVVVAGFGLARAQAQHTLRVLVDMLATRGVGVRFAVHPVAGRLPGQVVELLGEAGIGPERIDDGADADRRLAEADVALVIGANDTVHPEPDRPGSPLSGMPTLAAVAARRVVVLDRSAATGYAGVGNPLFAAEHTSVLLGDAADSLLRVVAALARL